MKKILDLFKKKEKKIEYEVVKSRSGLPMFVLPLPDGINFDIEEPEKGDKDEWRNTKWFCLRWWRIPQS